MREILSRSFDARQVPPLLARPSGGMPEGVVIYSELNKAINQLSQEINQQISLELNTQGSDLNMALQDILARVHKVIDPLTKITLGNDDVGDMYYRSGDGGLNKVPIGDTGQVLGIITLPDARLPGWISPYRFEWIEIYGSGDMNPNTGYICNSGSSIINLALPNEAQVGATVSVAAKFGTLFSIHQNVNQSVRFLGISTTSGINGRIDSKTSDQYINLLCVTENTDWIVLTASGEFNLV